MTPAAFALHFWRESGKSLCGGAGRHAGAFAAHAVKRPMTIKTGQ
jgi:hypothetical protein